MTTNFKAKKYQDEQGKVHLVWWFPSSNFVDSETFCKLPVDDNLKEVSTIGNCTCKDCKNNW